MRLAAGPRRSQRRSALPDSLVTSRGAGARRRSTATEPAFFLDATFAMPHLRLGPCSGVGATCLGARRELQNASMLLAQEDPARVLLFGGGFSRGTLIDLCARIASL